jgi:hypothetical protein
MVMIKTKTKEVKKQTLSKLSLPQLAILLNAKEMAAKLEVTKATRHPLFIAFGFDETHEIRRDKIEIL